MRKAHVLCNKILAGTLTEVGKSAYVFCYDDLYFADPTRPAIGLAFPKIQQEFRGSGFFPLFSNMLAEGVNLRLQSRQLRIDEDDAFGILLATAQHNTIGAITVQPLVES